MIRLHHRSGLRGECIYSEWMTYVKISPEVYKTPGLILHFLIYINILLKLPICKTVFTGEHTLYARPVSQLMYGKFEYITFYSSCIPCSSHSLIASSGQIEL